MNYFMPVKLVPDAKALAKECARCGSNCLIVTGARSAAASGALGDMEAAFEAAGISYRVFDGITSNPAVSACREAGKAAYAFGAEFIVGIGGGSALDAAKAASVFAANPWLDEAGFYAKSWAQSPLPVFLTGTTAGTGSEVTKVSVLTDSSGRKHSIHDDMLYARAATGGAKYTRACSKQVTLSAGIDIVCHCAESFLCKKAGDVSRAFAAQGLRLACAPLLSAAKGEALSETDLGLLYDASILGGMAINLTGTCFPHNAGYYLTENAGVPHGLACACLLPDMLGIIEERVPEEKHRFEKAAGVGFEDIKALCALCTAGLDISTDAFALDSALPRWAGNGSVNNTLGEVTLDDIYAALRRYAR